LEDDAIKTKILDLQDNEGCSALHLGTSEGACLENTTISDIVACMNGKEAMVRFLCEQGANVKLVDNESHSLIHWITGNASLRDFMFWDNLPHILVCGHLHLFDILLQYKAPIHTADTHAAFPIHYASQLCGVSVSDDLKIDSAKGKMDYQSIFLKDVDCFWLGLAILQIFIDRKVDIDCIDGQNRTPLMWAASAGERIIPYNPFDRI
jgi:hypothetical protein